MNVGTSISIVIVTAFVTLAIRFTPFLLFGSSKRQIPQVITYLGSVLPPAVMAALVVYSVKHISFVDSSLWLNEIIGILVTAVIHLWKRNTLLSIIIGTIVYMILVQGNFH